MHIPTTPASAAGNANGVVDATRGAVIGAKTTFPFPTADELRARQASQLDQQKVPAVRLPIDTMLMNGGNPSGVVLRTFSERVAELVTVAAKSMGLTPTESGIAAELPDVFAVIHPEPTLAAEMSAPVSVPPGTTLIKGEIGAVDAAVKIVEAQPAGDTALAADSLTLKPARRSPMPMVQRLRVLELVRAAPADKPDAELAADISLAIDRAVGSATVADYRKQLGMASVRMPSKAELQAKLRALQAKLDEQAQPTLPAIDPKA